MSWHAKTLGDLATFQRGFDITKKEQVPGPFPVISSSGANSTHNKSKVSGPGVVIGRKGSLGTVHFSEDDFWPHDTTLWVKNFHGNDPRFVYYYLQSLSLERFDVGSSNPTLNRNHIHPLPARFPDPPLQREIVSILSAYDDLIANNKRRIALLEESTRLLYREWFVYLRFPGHEHVEVVDGVPEGWERVTVPDIIDIKPTTKAEKGKEIWCVGMSSLSETGMTMDAAQFEKRTKHTSVRFMNGDTLFARITPCLENGKTAFVQFLEGGEVACGSTELIVLRGRRVSPYFTYCLSRTYSFRENAIKSMTGSSGRQRVQDSCFEKYHLGLPPQYLLDAFDDVAASCFRQIRLLELQNDKLKQARDILLPCLMNGEIAV